MDKYTEQSLNVLIDQAVMTIENDALWIAHAEQHLKKDGFIQVRTIVSAIKACGNDMYQLYNGLVKGDKGSQEHKYHIRRLISKDVASGLDLPMKSSVVDREAFIKDLVYRYRTRCDFTAIEKRIQSHITAKAYNDMSETEQVNWLTSAYGGTPTLATSTKGGGFVWPSADDVYKDIAEACRTLDGSIDRNKAKQDFYGMMYGGSFHRNHDAYFRKELTMAKDRPTHPEAFNWHLPDCPPVTAKGDQLERMGEILGHTHTGTIEDNITTQPENSKMLIIKDTAVPIEKREPLIFGQELTKLSKDELMEVIRAAKNKAASYEDLAGESKHVDDLISGIEKGLVLCFKALDKK